MRKCGQTRYVIDAELGCGEVSEPVSLGRGAGVGVRRQRLLQRCKLGASHSPCTGGRYPAVTCEDHPHHVTFPQTLQKALPRDQPRSGFHKSLKVTQVTVRLQPGYTDENNLPQPPVRKMGLFLCRQINSFQRT